jgi:integrase
MLVEGLAAGPFVFCDPIGGPLRRQNIQRRSFRPILKAVKVPTIRFHDLRHTAATFLVLANINPKIVSETLGHASIAITPDTYKSRFAIDGEGRRGDRESHFGGGNLRLATTWLHLVV